MRIKKCLPKISHFFKFRSLAKISNIIQQTIVKVKEEKLLIMI